MTIFLDFATINSLTTNKFLIKNIDSPIKSTSPGNLMKKLTLFSLSFFIFSSHIYAAQLTKLVVGASYALAATTFGTPEFRTPQHLLTKINPINEAFIPFQIRNESSEENSCFLVTQATVQDEIIYNTKEAKETTYAIENFLSNFPNTYLRGNPESKTYKKVSMTECPKGDYVQLYKKTKTYPELFILGPKGWVPPTGFEELVEGFSYNKAPEIEVDESYTNTFRKTICTGNPDPEAWGCVFIVPFSHGAITSVRAEEQANKLAQDLREQGLLETKDIDMDSCISDPNIPVRKLFCTHDGDCVAVAYRLIGKGGPQANEAIQKAIDNFAPKDFIVPEPQRCSTVTDSNVCCIPNNLKKVDL